MVTPTPAVKTAQPRLAVALDFADIVGRESDKNGMGVFESIISDSLAAPFTVQVNPRLGLPDVNWIQGASLYLYNGASKTPISVEVNNPAPNTLSLAIGTSGQKQLAGFIARPDNYTLFLEIAFADNVRSPLFSHYDITSPWAIRMELTQPREEATPFFWAEISSR